jgi:hypothetical protein
VKGWRHGSRCDVRAIRVQARDIQNGLYHVLNNAEYDDILDDDNDKHLVLGFDSKTNLLEILYNVVDEQTVRVFHAMKCTQAFRVLLDR